MINSVSNAYRYYIGNTVGIGINKSIYNEVYNISFLDPYATKDAVSLGYNIYFRETDYGEFNIANYLTNSAGFGAQFGYPISDTQRLSFNLTYDKTDIDIGSLPAREIYDFVAAEGNVFETLSAGVSWQTVTLNRGLFPTDGASTSLSLSSTVPGSDLSYYRINLRQRYYQPLSSDLIFGFQGELGYLSAYGETEETPFFQNFYAGGPRSLRGFESNTLGPRSTDAPCYEFNYEEGTCPNLLDTDGDGELDSPYYNPYANNTSRYRDAPIGGNIKVEGSLQMIFRLPFIEDQRSMRSAFFFDFGNVFSDNCKDYQINCYKPSIDDLRYSYGVGITWITGFGPMSFAISKPTNAGPQERTEEFLIAFLFAAVPLMAMDGVAVIDMRTAVLSTQAAADAFKALEEDPDYSSNLEEAQSLQAERQAIAEKLQKELETLSQEEIAQMQKEIQDKGKDLEFLAGKIQQAQEETAQKVFASSGPAMQKIIGELIAAKQIKVLMAKNETLLFSDPALDLTDDVTSMLDVAAAEANSTSR